MIYSSSRRTIKLLTLFVLHVSLFGISAVCAGDIVFHEEAQGQAIIYIISSDGTNLKKIGKGLFPQWSPDGKLISYVDYIENANPANVRGLVVMDTSGKEVARFEFESDFSSIVCSAWRPDSKGIALVTAHGRHDGTIRYFDLVDKNIRSLNKIGFADLDIAFARTTLAWMSDGKQLISIAPIGEGVAVIDISSGNIKNISDKGMLPRIIGNKILFFINSEVWNVNLDGSGRKMLLDTGSAILGASDIVDNKVILQVNTSKEQGFPKIKLYLLNLQNNSLKEISGKGTMLFCPVISPDGKKITAIGMKTNKDTGKEEDIGYYIYDIGAEKAILLKRFDEKKESEQIGFQMFLGYANHSNWRRH